MEWPPEINWQSATVVALFGVCALGVGGRNWFLPEEDLEALPAWRMPDKGNNAATR